MSKTKAHWTHWVISVLLLLWNALGAANFIAQSDPNFVALLPEEYQAIIATRPVWATFGFGLAVFGGVLGAILLAIRARAAFWVLALSAIGATLAVVQGFTWGGVMQIATAVAAAIYARLVAQRAYPGSKE